MKILTTSLLLALAAPAVADIITLNDGTKLDAKILSKTLEEFELEVSVTSSIKERRTIKRADVASVEQTNDYDKVFEDEIAGLAPAPPFTSLEEYEKRIKKIEAFLSEHKVTSAGTKAARMLRELTTERDFIKKGGLKTSMKEEGMISADQREENALEIDSQAAAGKFKSLVEARSFLAALRQYDQLERDFYGSKAQRESMDLMSRLTRSYAALLDRDLAGFDAKEERRLKTLDRLSDNERARATEAEDQRKAAFEKLWSKEEEEGQSWFTVDTENAGSLEDAVNSLFKEADRIEELKKDLEDFPETGDLYRRGWIAAGEKNKEELEVILDEMDEAGVAESYVNALIDRFDPTINEPPVEEEEGAEKEEGAEEEEGAEPAEEEEAAEEEIETTE